jgi:hypothetical protein
VSGGRGCRCIQLAAVGVVDQKGQATMHHAYGRRQQHSDCLSSPVPAFCLLPRSCCAWRP